MAQSRLNKRMQEQTRRNLMFSLIGTIAVIVLLFKFGLPILSDMVAAISGGKSTNADTTKKVSIFIPPPVIDSLPSATNSAKISVSGSALKDYRVDLYINDERIDKTAVDDKGKFKFDNIRLQPKQNTVKAKAVDTKADQESEFSNELDIEFKSNAPTLEVSSPSDGQTFNKDDNNAKISGKTDPSAKVYVNDLWAIVDDSGNFSYNLPLKPDENTLKIKAVDEAGNSTEKTLKVIYHP